MQLKLLVLSKFRGSMLGALVGDCLGAPFEGEAAICKTHLNNYFHQILDPSIQVPYKPYTDDTAMTKMAALSLIENKGYDAKDMAKRFTQEYFAHPKRGYGSAIGDVFFKLRQTNFQDPYGPGRNQFKGLGSYGNGAAMRVTPVALFAYGKNPEDLKSFTKLVTDTSKITHSNKLGYRGAILQALAIRQALLIDTHDFDRMHYTNQLIDKMRELEWNDDPDDPIDGGKSYVTKLEIVKSFLSGGKEPDTVDIQKKLGVHVSALDSVPTAIYCFLAAQKPLDEIETDCKFQRCVQYAISLGGDTDTIASMAGAIVGAHLGHEVIPTQFLVHSEDSDIIAKLADALFEAAKPSESNTESTSDEGARAAAVGRAANN